MAARPPARRIGSLCAGAAVAVVGMAVPPATAADGRSSATSQAAITSAALGAPGTWTKLSRNTGGGSFEPGLLRTKDGRLHVVWPYSAGGKWGLGYSTVAPSGSVLATGTVLSGWLSLQPTPKLVPFGAGLRLVFNGAQDGNLSNPFSLGARYTATSTNGVSWTLVHGSMSSRTVFNTSLAATTKADGTPVSAEGLNADLLYHVGVDPATPSGTPDTVVTDPSAYGLMNAALARDTASGVVYLGWYQRGSTKGTGYYVKAILPAPAAAREAPRSNGQGLPDNSPAQGVALAARVGGGVYLAYCEASKTQRCARIDLWKVGSASALSVPRSAGADASQVSLSAGPGGRLVVGWFSRAAKVIRVVRTNTAATRFGVVRTVKPPVRAADLAFFDGLFTESSRGPMDLVANVQRFSGGAPIAFFHTQVLPGLSLSARPRPVPRGKKVVFRVRDAGQPVAGARVRFLGRTLTTNGKGKASIKADVAKGRYKAIARKGGYFRAIVKVRVR